MAGSKAEESISVLKENPLFCENNIYKTSNSYGEGTGFAGYFLSFWYSVHITLVLNQTW